ncbi:hypothetical protein [Streptomyces sp. ALI-76-A]|jgi:hypothetical protein|uniref:hypothetical protein n=1 Tax=Streptomyces sp. ALI-76-A TaxID=3025736 RepID=UPI00256F3F62|nr:hypothetical protein [Streptomyces sp. ALI-76-A]MDL5199316.1 hypothetical protein [Streptomyces sp. ALI-76-A]
MHRIRAALAAAGLAVALGTALPATAEAVPAGAQGPNCDAQYNAHREDGNMRAYLLTDCSNLLGTASGNDANWGDSSGPFTGADNNFAWSILNTGTYSGGVNNVQFYDGVGSTGGTGCLARGELYVDDLRDNVFHNGVRASNAISSHRWSSGCTNRWT